jgi:hypothetical protein
VKEASDPKPLTPEQLSSLLETLREIVAKASGRPVDMELLQSTIEEAVQWYRADPWVAREFEKMTVHEIEAPVRTLAILKNDANSGVVFDALAGDDIFKGVRRRTALIAYLERLVARAFRQHPPPQNPANRPAGIDLRLFVGHLANCWSLLVQESDTGAPLVPFKARFTNRWHRNPDKTVSPVSLGAQFVHAVLKVVDSSRLTDLPTAMRWVIEQRSKGKFPGYFNDNSRKDAL